MYTYSRTKAEECQLLALRVLLAPLHPDVGAACREQKAAERSRKREAWSAGRGRNRTAPSLCFSPGRCRRSSALSQQPRRGLRRNRRWEPRARTEGPRAAPPGGPCSVSAPPRAGGQRRRAGVRGRWRRGRAVRRALHGREAVCRACGRPAAARAPPPLFGSDSGKVWGFREGLSSGRNGGRAGGGGAERSDDEREVLRASPRRRTPSSEAVLPALWGGARRGCRGALGLVGSRRGPSAAAASPRCPPRRSLLPAGLCR